MLYHKATQDLAIKPGSCKKHPAYCYVWNVDRWHICCDMNSDMVNELKIIFSFFLSQWHRQLWMKEILKMYFGFCQGSSTDLLSHQTSLIPTHLLMEQQVLGPHHPLLFIKDSDFSHVSILESYYFSLHNKSDLCWYKLDSWGPKGDQHQFSPNVFNTKPRKKVMRIYEIITKGKVHWSFIIFSQLILWENVWKSVRRICMLIFSNQWMRLSRIWRIKQMKEGVIHRGRRLL